MWSVQALASQQAAQLQLASQQAANLQVAVQPGPYAGVRKVSKDELPPPQKVGRGAVVPDPIAVVAPPRASKPPPQQKGSGKKWGKSGGKGKPVKPKHVPIELTMVSVKGYSEDTTKEELKEHFKEAGFVQAVQILKKEEKACVKFKSDTEAAQAILMFNCSEIKGKMLEVVEWSGPIPSGISAGGGAASSWGEDDYGWNPMMPMMAMMSVMMGAMSHKQGDDKMHGDKKTMVFVGNLNPNVGWQDLKDHMKVAGKVEHVVKSKPKTGCVRYSTAEEAQKAIAELNGTKLKDCEIQVDKWG